MQESSSSIKDRTVKHWSAVPIGTQTVGFSSEHEEFSKEYFEDQSRFRYDVYAPWLRSVAGFERFPGKALLEVGCGMGSDLLEFARNSARSAWSGISYGAAATRLALSVGISDSHSRMVIRTKSSIASSTP